MPGVSLLCAGQECWSWRSAGNHVEYTREAWFIADRSGDATNFGDSTPASREKVSRSSVEAALSMDRIFDLLELSRHSLLAMVAFKVARFFGVKDPAARSRLRWWLAVSSGRADGINAKLLAASTEYANMSNAIIIEMEEALNQHLFSWVDTKTTTHDSVGTL
ncbi:hypothetical protein ACQY0O_006632 [Thecaphora frezii]